jgi:hypothetical protein
MVERAGKIDSFKKMALPPTPVDEALLSNDATWERGSSQETRASARRAVSLIDSDPYMVINDEGILWMCDGYT